MKIKNHTACTVLVTCAGAGPAVAVIKALKEQTDFAVRVIAVDADPLAAGLYLAHRHYLVPLASQPGYLKKILQISKKEKVRYVFPILDTETPVFARNKEVFKKAGIHVFVNPPEVIEKCNDKLRTYQECRVRGIPAPKIYSPQEIRLKQVCFPAILKRRSGMGAKDSRVIDHPRDLNALLPLRDPFLIQDFIPGREFTVDGLLSPDGTPIALVPRERLVVKSGQSVKGRTVNLPAVQRFCEKVCAVFGLRGAVCIQVMLHRKKIYLVEINPRYGTGISLTIGAGVNMPLLQLKQALGKPISRKETRFIPGLYMIRYWEEVLIRRNEMAGSVS